MTLTFLWLSPKHYDKGTSIAIGDSFRLQVIFYFLKLQGHLNIIRENKSFHRRF